MAPLQLAHETLLRRHQLRGSVLPILTMAYNARGAISTLHVSSGDGGLLIGAIDGTVWVWRLFPSPSDSTALTVASRPGSPEISPPPGGVAPRLVLCWEATPADDGDDDDEAPSITCLQTLDAGRIAVGFDDGVVAIWGIQLFDGFGSAAAGSAPELCCTIDAHVLEPESDDDDSSSDEESSDEESELDDDDDDKQKDKEDKSQSGAGSGDSGDDDDDDDGVSLPDESGGVFEIRAVRSLGDDGGPMELFTCGGSARRVRHWLVGGDDDDDDDDEAEAEERSQASGDAGSRGDVGSAGSRSDRLKVRELSAHGVAEEFEPAEGDAYTSWVQATIKATPMRLELLELGMGAESIARRLLLAATSGGLVTLYEILAPEWRVATCADRLLQLRRGALVDWEEKAGEAAALGDPSEHCVLALTDGGHVEALAVSGAGVFHRSPPPEPPLPVATVAASTLKSGDRRPPAKRIARGRAPLVGLGRHATATERVALGWMPASASVVVGRSDGVLEVVAPDWKAALLELGCRAADAARAKRRAATPLAGPRGHLHEVTALDAFPGQGVLLSASLDRSVALWRARPADDAGLELLKCVALGHPIYSAVLVRRRGALDAIVADGAHVSRVSLRGDAAAVEGPSLLNERSHRVSRVSLAQSSTISGTAASTPQLAADPRPPPAGLAGVAGSAGSAASVDDHSASLSFATVSLQAPSAAQAFASAAALGDLVSSGALPRQSEIARSSFLGGNLRARTPQPPPPPRGRTPSASSWLASPDPYASGDHSRVQSPWRTEREVERSRRESVVTPGSAPPRRDSLSQGVWNLAFDRQPTTADESPGPGEYLFAEAPDTIQDISAKLLEQTAAFAPALPASRERRENLPAMGSRPATADEDAAAAAGSKADASDDAQLAAEALITQSGPAPPAPELEALPTSTQLAAYPDLVVAFKQRDLGKGFLPGAALPMVLKNWWKGPDGLPITDAHVLEACLKTSIFREADEEAAASMGDEEDDDDFDVVSIDELRNLREIRLERRKNYKRRGAKVTFDELCLVAETLCGVVGAAPPREGGLNVSRTLSRGGGGWVRREPSRDGPAKAYRLMSRERKRLVYGDVGEPALVRVDLAASVAPLEGPNCAEARRARLLTSRDNYRMETPPPMGDARARLGTPQSPNGRSSRGSRDDAFPAARRMPRLPQNVPEPFEHLFVDPLMQTARDCLATGNPNPSGSGFEQDGDAPQPPVMNGRTAVREARRVFEGYAEELASAAATKRPPRGLAEATYLLFRQRFGPRQIAEAHIVALLDALFAHGTEAPVLGALSRFIDVKPALVEMFEDGRASLGDNDSHQSAPRADWRALPINSARTYVDTLAWLRDRGCLFRDAPMDAGGGRGLRATVSGDALRHLSVSRRAAASCVRQLAPSPSVASTVVEALANVPGLDESPLGHWDEHVDAEAFAELLTTRVVAADEVTRAAQAKLFALERPDRVLSTAGSGKGKPSKRGSRGDKDAAWPESLKELKRLLLRFVAADPARSGAISGAAFCRAMRVGLKAKGGNDGGWGPWTPPSELPRDESLLAENERGLQHLLVFYRDMYDQQVAYIDFWAMLWTEATLHRRLPLLEELYAIAIDQLIGIDDEVGAALRAFVMHVDRKELPKVEEKDKREDAPGPGRPVLEPVEVKPSLLALAFPGQLDMGDLDRVPDLHPGTLTIARPPDAARDRERDVFGDTEGASRAATAHDEREDRPDRSISEERRASLREKSTSTRASGVALVQDDVSSHVDVAPEPPEAFPPAASFSRSLQSSASRDDFRDESVDVHSTIQTLPRSFTAAGAQAAAQLMLDGLARHHAAEALTHARAAASHATLALTYADAALPANKGGTILTRLAASGPGKPPRPPQVRGTFAYQGDPFFAPQVTKQTRATKADARAAAARALARGASPLLKTSLDVLRVQSMTGQYDSFGRAFSPVRYLSLDEAEQLQRDIDAAQDEADAKRLAKTHSKAVAPKEKPKKVDKAAEQRRLLEEEAKRRQEEAMRRHEEELERRRQEEEAQAKAAEEAKKRAEEKAAMDEAAAKKKAEEEEAARLKAEQERRLKDLEAAKQAEAREKAEAKRRQAEEERAAADAEKKRLKEVAAAEKEARKQAEREARKRQEGERQAMYQEERLGHMMREQLREERAAAERKRLQDIKDAEIAREAEENRLMEEAEEEGEFLREEEREKARAAQEALEREKQEREREEFERAEREREYEECYQMQAEEEYERQRLAVEAEEERKRKAKEEALRERLDAEGRMKEENERSTMITNTLKVRPTNAGLFRVAKQKRASIAFKDKLLGKVAQRRATVAAAKQAEEEAAKLEAEAAATARKMGDLRAGAGRRRRRRRPPPLFGCSMAFSADLRYDPFAEDLRSTKQPAAPVGSAVAAMRAKQDDAGAGGFDETSLEDDRLPEAVLRCFREAAGGGPQAFYDAVSDLYTPEEEAAGANEADVVVAHPNVWEKYFEAKLDEVFRTDDSSGLFAALGNRRAKDLLGDANTQDAARAYRRVLAGRPEDGGSVATQQSADLGAANMPSPDDTAPLAFGVVKHASVPRRGAAAYFNVDLDTPNCILTVMLVCFKGDADLLVSRGRIPSASDADWQDTSLGQEKRVVVAPEDDRYGSGKHAIAIRATHADGCSFAVYAATTGATKASVASEPMRALEPRLRKLKLLGEMGTGALLRDFGAAANDAAELVAREVALEQAIASGMRADELVSRSDFQSEQKRNEELRREAKRVAMEVGSKRDLGDAAGGDEAPGPAAAPGDIEPDHIDAKLDQRDLEEAWNVSLSELDNEDNAEDAVAFEKLLYRVGVAQMQAENASKPLQRDRHLDARAPASASSPGKRKKRRRRKKRSEVMEPGETVDDLDARMRAFVGTNGNWNKGVNARKAPRTVPPRAAPSNPRLPPPPAAEGRESQIEVVT
ncbi:hypothetical protein JL721_12101 [Aureococcus anophagefferens]|nr:hypothetical protein JL721_12101 [Aureococcus anophagefferens]